VPRPTITVDTDRLRTRRKAAGLSQEALASRVDVSHGTIGHLEVGRRQPSLPLAIAIARVLECSVSDFADHDVDADDLKALA
jgi:putative transcriptional regulator